MKRAFTLIELLAVIAIIAILAALLMPALQQARIRAKQAKCQGNLHNIGLGISMWRGDHGQRWIAGKTSYYDYGDCELQAFVMRDYLQDWRVYLCPSYNGAPRNPGIAYQNQWYTPVGGGLSHADSCYEPPTNTNYTYNYAWTEDICYFYDEKDVADNPDPARVIDADGYAMFDWRGPQPADHKDGASELFVDNSVQYVALAYPQNRWTMTAAQEIPVAEFAPFRMSPSDPGPFIYYGYQQNPRIDEDQANRGATNPPTADYDSIYHREGTPAQWGAPNPNTADTFYFLQAHNRNALDNGLPPPDKVDACLGGGAVCPDWWGGSTPMYRGPYSATMWQSTGTPSTFVGWTWGMTAAFEPTIYQ